MGKLLGHQIKNHFRYNWFIPILPILLFLSGLALNLVNKNWAPTLVGLGFMALIFGYFAAAITVMVGDYNMFFGDSALFYESTPISPAAKTFSRFLYYFIMFLFYSIFVMGILSIGLVAEPSSVNADIDSFNLSSIFEIIDKIGVKNILISLAWLLLFLTNNIAKIIFSISLGGGKRLRRFGLGGPVLAYIITGLVEGIILYLLNMTDLFTNMELLMNDGKVFMNVTGGAFLMAIGIETVFFLCSVYLIHKNRISVN